MTPVADLLKSPLSQKVLVIGGAGFIGRCVVSALQRAGSQVRVMDFAAAPLDLVDVDWISGSISDSTLVGAAVEGCDSVIFLANASLPGSSQGDLALEASGHVGATLRVAEICKHLGTKRFLFASSGGTVYGYNAPSEGLMEGDMTRPLNAYGVSKLSIEHYLRLLGGYEGPMRTLSLRLSNPYGPRQRAHRSQGVVAAAMQHAIADTVMPIWGDGTVERDFLHVEDVGLAFVAGLSHEGPSSVINIGAGEATSLNDMLAAIRRHTGRKLAVDYQSNRRIDVHRNKLSIGLAQTELCWSPQISLEDGLAATARW